MSLCWCNPPHYETPPKASRPVGAEPKVLSSGELQGTGPRTEPAGTPVETCAQYDKSATRPTVIGVNAGRCKGPGELAA